MMRRTFQRFLYLIWITILLTFLMQSFFRPSMTQAAADAKSSETRILVITSQPYATEWFNSFNTEFVEEINKVRPIQPKISYEYIDGKIASDPAMSDTVVTYLKHKYDWKNIDLVIGVMTAGSTFILEQGDNFAKDIPQLYVLPSAQQLQKINVKSSVGAIKSTGDAITGTLKNIRTVLPQTKNLYVAAGVGPDDKEYFERTRKVLNEDKIFENVVYLAGFDSAELINELSTAPKDSVVMLLTYVLNRHGQPVTTTQVLRSVAPMISVPIFSFYDTVYGSGIVGGNLTSSEAYGEASAAAAHRLLNGEQKFFALTVPPRYMYDWRELKRWNIEESRLP